MQILGNAFLAVAALIYIVPIQWLAFESPVGKRDEGGGAVWTVIFILVPFWLLIAGGLFIVTGRGGLEWIGRERWMQHLLAATGVIGLFIVTAFCYVGKFQPHNLFPAVLRPLMLLMLLAVPLIALFFCAMTLNAELLPKVRPQFYRIPFAVVGTIGLLAFVGVIGQSLFSNVLRRGVALTNAVSRESERDRQILERVATLDPHKDFAELIGFANRYENQKIRELAIGKAQSHPDFDAALEKVLRSGLADEALTYLDACDVPNPERFADAVNAAIRRCTEWVRESVANTHTFHTSAFDSSTRRILSVVDKFRGNGVDYVPAIREYRRAMDSKRTVDVEFNARRTLDKWLAKHSHPAKP
jgi:hypothetical protein